MSKKSGEAASTKTQNKEKAKTINDLTFGLKNKNKSKVVQNYVKEVTSKVTFANVKVSFSSSLTRNLGWPKSCRRCQQR